MEIVEDLVMDKPLETICYDREISRRHLEMLIDDYQAEIGTWEDRILKRLQRTTLMGLARLEEALTHNAIPPEKLASAITPLITQRELIAGKPTSRSGSSKDVEIDDNKLNQMIQTLDAVDVDVEEVKSAPKLPE